MKKTLALVLALVMVFALCACGAQAPETGDNAGTGNTGSSTLIADENNDGQIEIGTVEDVEVNEASEHMDAAEASASGNWEALFVPVQIEGRAIEMTDFDLTPTAEELEAMKNEPAYGRPIVYLMSDGCTSGPTMADHLGYYAEAGLTAEGLKGTTDVEGLGTGKVDVASGMMAKMLVPITNGVDITFVGGSHIGCKSLYVLADSEAVQELFELFEVSAADVQQPLADFFHEKVEEVPGGEISFSNSVLRIFSAAHQQVASSGRDLIELTDLFIALYTESNSYAVWLLNSLGLEETDMRAAVTDTVHPELRGAEEDDVFSSAKQGLCALELYTVNMTALAKDGKLDDVVGRSA